MKLTVYNSLRSLHPPAGQRCIDWVERGDVTYLTSSMTFLTSTSDLRSTFKIEGGDARVNPVPTTSQPPLLNSFTTCLPRRPVAPVMRAFLAIVLVRRWLTSVIRRWAVGGESVDRHPCIKKIARTRSCL